MRVRGEGEGGGVAHVRGVVGVVVSQGPGRGLQRRHLGRGQRVLRRPQS